MYNMLHNQLGLLNSTKDVGNDKVIDRRYSAKASVTQCNLRQIT